MEWTFFVEGIPMTKGSWKAIQNKKTGRIFLRPDSNKLRPWENEIKNSARQIYRGPLLDGPVSFQAVFFMPRGKSAWKVDGSLVKGAPPFPLVKDVDKLLRAVMDALTGVMWVDDKQVMHADVRKQYVAKKNDPCGAWVRVDSAYG